MVRRFAALAALLVLCSLAMGQVKPEWTVEKSYQGAIAELKIQGRRVADVWDTAMKVLFKMKNTEVVGDKPSGSITARRPGARITFLLSQSNGAVDITARWEYMGGERARLPRPSDFSMSSFLSSSKPSNEVHHQRPGPLHNGRRRSRIGP
jgi:hypothetical protein